MKKIYLAGPDVFEKNSIEVGKNYVQLCKDYGFEGLYPLDNVINFNQEKEKIAKEIFEKNCELIRKCDIVIANLNAFRGKEPDSGTIWECGYAYALGKKVYGYLNDSRPYKQRFKEDEKIMENGKFYDNDEKEIENFNLPLNLMISCSSVEIIEGGLKEVLSKLSL